MSGAFARRDGSGALQAFLAEEDIVVATLGNATFDLFDAKDRDLNYYMWGGMGLAADVGLGMAIALPGRRVIILDGDGSLLMNPNALIAIGAHRPANLLHIVWDNGIYETTGGQSTGSRELDLLSVARACGYREVALVEDLDAFKTAIRPFFAQGGPKGPQFVQCYVSGERALRKPSPDPQIHTARFMAALRATLA